MKEIIYEMLLKMLYPKKLNISDNDNSLDLDLALAMASYFRLNADEANEIINQVHNSVKEWRHLAAKYGISSSEQERMKGAFS